MNSRQQQGEKRGDEASWRRLAFFPVLTYACLMLGLLSHDRRVMFVAFAGVFATLAVYAHLKKLHPVVRVAFIAGLIGASLAAWFYGFRAV